jgi:hypothetical protein
MAVKFADRVRQISVSTGTGDITFSASESGYRNFSAVYTPVTDEVPYCIEGLTAGGDLSGQWETGRGHLDNTGKLVRDELYASSTGSLVNFSSASLRVFVTASSLGLDDWVASKAPPTTRAIVAGNGLTGGGDFSADRTLNVAAHADGSIVVSANDVQVGVLATDAQHGNRGNGSLHSTFSASAAGFAPASGGGTTNFLRADGTWAAPGGGGSIDGAGATDRIAYWSDADTLTSSAGLTFASDTLSVTKTVSVSATAAGDTATTQISNSTGGDVLLMAHGSSVAGTRFGQTLAQSTEILMQAGTGSFLLGTFAARDVVLGTNATAALTIDGATQAATFSSDLTVGGNNLNINTVGYAWPGTQGAASTVLTNDGSGNLTWAAAGAGSMSIGGSVGSGTVGSVLFVDTGPVLAQDATFAWDNANKKLNLGTPSGDYNRLNVREDDNTAASSTTFWNKTFGGISIANNSATANTVAGIGFSHGASNNAISGIGSIQESSSLAALAFFAGGSGVSNTVPERMRISSNGNVGIGGTSAGHKLSIVGGTLATTKQALLVTGTLAAGASADEKGVVANITSVNGSQNSLAAGSFNLTPGFTSNAQTTALEASNSAAGTGSDNFLDAGQYRGNLGIQAFVSSTTTGTNIGTLSIARGGNKQYGLLGLSDTAKSGATQVGVAGMAVSPGGGGFGIGGYFRLGAGTPTFVQSALVVDSNVAGANLVTVQDSAASVFTIADGGDTTIAPVSGHTNHALSVVAGTLAASKRALNVTATLPNSASGQHGVVFDITANASATGSAVGLNLTLNAGPTGNINSHGIVIENAVAGNTAGSTPLAAFQSAISGSRNSGVQIAAYGATGGVNVGAHNIATAAATAIGAINVVSETYAAYRQDSLNIASINAVTGAKHGSSTTEKHLGAVGLALNGDVNIAGLFSLQNTTPTFSGAFASAGLIACNGATSSDIARFVDDTTIVATIPNGGGFHPGANDTYDLGTDALRWRDIFLGPGTLHIGTSTSDEGTISYNTASNSLLLSSTGNVTVSTDFVVDGDMHVDTNFEVVGTLTASDVAQFDAAIEEKFSYLTSDTTLGDFHRVVAAIINSGTNSTRTITLPLVSTCLGRIYVIKAGISGSGNTVTIENSGSDVFEGGAGSITLSENRCCITLMACNLEGSDGWLILNYLPGTTIPSFSGGGAIAF